MGPIWLRVVFLTVLVLDGAEWSDGCWDEERIAIFQLRPFLLFAGFNWTEERVSDCCQWEFVECNTTTRRVTRLSLAEAISSNLFNASLFLPFEELRSLDLRGNGLVGYAKNQGFRKLSKLRHLENLDLTFNNFNDSILSSLSKLSSLKSLSLGGNDLFTGSDHNIELSGLETLDLSLTNMKNNLLLHLGGLSSLTTLLLGGNNLEGTLHLQGNGREQSLINLEEIDLSDNLFNNSVVAELSGFSNLRKLTDFLYEISPEFCGWSSLESLDLSYNERREANCNISVAGSRCLRKLKTLYLDGVSTKQNVSLTSLLEPFSSVKTLFLRENSYLSKAVATQELHVLSDVENLFLDNTAVDISFLQSIGILTSLKTLSLSNCSLTGTLPAHQGLCYLNNLEELKLNGNALGGVIASCLVNLTSLRFLDISNNHFTGNIASTPLTNLTMLRFLSLSQNQFRVPVSFKSFANHSDLKILLADENKLVGDSAAFGTWLPKFQLEIFCLSNCTTEEHEKVQLPEFLYFQHDLRYVGLSYSNFGGIRFPHWLLQNNTRLEELYMIDSSIVGPLVLPSHPSSELKVLDMSKNKIQHDIPRNFCSLFPHLVVLVMSKNAFETNIPLCLGGMKRNHFEGPIPMGLCSLVYLGFLDLSTNHFSGIIPSCSSLQKMKHVHLAQNELSGTLSDSLFNSSSLVTLDLSENNLTGRIPDWISRLLDLGVLLMKANQFSGEIPLHLCRLQSLSILDLSQNKLSGHVPSCLSNLTLKPRSEKSSVDAMYYRADSFDYVLEDMGLTIYYLTKDYWGSVLQLLTFYPLTFEEEEIQISTKGATYTYKGNILDLLSAIDLSCNQFTGIIPPALGNLSEIRGLNLSHNNLTGPIPSTFSKLKQIESLDLSYNNLIGRIPSELTELTALEIFTVAYNDLSGPLPDRKAQFGTFDESSYKGNSLLCGPPLSKSCNEGGSLGTPSASSREEEDGAIGMGDFYMSFTVSYAIIFLTTVIVLYINPHWRRACYYLVVDSLGRLPCFRRNL
ncbi:hypothetical protein V6N11_068362 [Hibiscus sabdariffa]|uniref:Leucine-rich repeat-containing N-terminal plant-type domain-containing protein n=1 Tax=Hibiscus sabdariffa TaxID=183260 RepID=A0ABR1ZAP5_9ROSI